MRADHCQFGTPYQKPQLWLTNCPGAEGLGAVCGHPKPHAVRLEGAKTRRSQPYPLPLAAGIVETVAAGLDRVTAVDLGRAARTSGKAVPHATSEEEAFFVQCGRMMLRAVRHGAPSALADDETLPGDHGGGDVEEEAGLGSPLEYERSTLVRLQREDADFRDISALEELATAA